MNLLKLKLKIKKMLIIASIPNAIGEIIEVTVVKLSLSKNVNMKPIIKSETITPNVTTTPR